MNTLPTGYVDLGFIAMHVADLRRHTADLYRFQKYLGLALELKQTEPYSDESFAVVDKAGDIEALVLTCKELSKVWLEASKATEDSQ